MSDNQVWSLRDVVIASLAIAFVFLVHGAVPFLMMPTLAQAVWSMGFSQSLANGPFFDFYAHDFGIPRPAAIAFGLAGAWPASLLIRLGLHPADAYAGMVALWLGLAMYSAYRLVRHFGAARPTALLGGVAWMTMPVIWAHSGYGMLSLGIALLSFYFLAAFRLFLIESSTKRITPATIVLYFTATIVSVFMDGYTFMMFVTGSSMLLLYSLVIRRDIRPVLIRISIPTHAISFFLAYLLYSAYIRTANFETQPIDFFRGWGLDLSFIAIPTKGVLWLPDFLGFSLERSAELYFGVGAVWTTSFALPVMLFGLFAWWRARRRMKIATGIFCVALFGFYMALGPSLKINSTKPESLRISHPWQQSALMSSEYAVIPTGNAWISKTLPGFNVMRASYRWSALTIFGFWLLIMIWGARSDRGKKRFFQLALFALVLFNLPHFQKHWQDGVNSRVMFREIDRDLVAKLQQNIRPTERVAFIPWRNDFIANYLASAAGFRTFNIGGDKNLVMAQSEWPPEMLGLGGEIDADKALSAVRMLVDGTTDVLVLPYFHMLWSPHLWPCIEQSVAKLSTEEMESVHRNIPGFICPSERRDELQPIVLVLRDLPYVKLDDSALFATIRLRPEFSGDVNRSALLSSILRDINYPIAPRAGLKEIPYVLREGWHALEAHHVWSQAAAKLMLPVPNECESKECDAVLKFTVFGASPQRAVSVVFDSTDQEWHWTKKIVANSNDLVEVKVPLAGQKGWRGLSIAIPDAKSPQMVSGSPDVRILGIALQSVDLIKNSISN